MNKTCITQYVIKAIVYITASVIFFAAAHVIFPICSKNCPSDEKTYKAMVMRLKWDIASLFKIHALRSSEVISDPRPYEMNHILATTGPKIGYALAGYLTYTVLSSVTSFSHRVALYKSFTILNVSLIYLQALILFFLMKKGKKETLYNTLNALLFTAFFIMSAPIQAQYLFFRTYNPLFGVQILLSLLMLCKASSISTESKWYNICLVAGGATAFSSLCVAPPSPLFIVAYFITAAIMLLCKKHTVTHITRAISAILSGGFIFLACLEAIYRIYGNSFIYLFYRHVVENVNYNQICMPFPYFPAIPISYLLLFAPGLIMALVLGCTVWMRGKKSPLSTAMLCGLIAWFILFEISPTVPLGRSLYAFTIMAFALISVTLCSLPQKALTKALILFSIINLLSYPMYTKSFCDFEMDGPLLEQLTGIYSQFKP